MYDPLIEMAGTIAVPVECRIPWGEEEFDKASGTRCSTPWLRADAQHYSQLPASTYAQRCGHQDLWRLRRTVLAQGRAVLTIRRAGQSRDADIDACTDTGVPAGATRKLLP